MYAYHDARGYLSRGPSLRQWSRLRRTLTGPVGAQFAASGMTHDPVALAIELNGRTDPESARLHRVSLRARETLIITDGVREL